MRLGIYNAILHDRSLPEAIKVVADLRKPRERTNEPSAWPEDMAVLGAGLAQLLPDRQHDFRPPERTALALLAAHLPSPCHP